METRVLVVVAVVLLAGFAPALATGSPPDDARLTVTDVSVSPTTPVPDEPVTMDVSLRNSAASPSAVEVDTVAVVTETNETVARAIDPGTLSPGDTLTVPLTAEFERPGVKRLAVVATGTDSEGNRTRVRRPLTVVVEAAVPQIDLSVRRAVAGESTPVGVSVSNPTTAPVRNLTVAVEGEDLAVVDGLASIPSLAAGETGTLNLTVRPEDPGEYTLDVTVAYTTAAGVPKRTRRERTVRVTPLETDVGIAVARAPQGDQTGQVAGGISGVLQGPTTEQEEDEDPSRVEVTVTNFGNAPIRGVEIEPRAGDRRLPRRSIAAPIAPGESAAVTVDLSQVRRPGPVEFAVAYRTGGDEHTATGVYDYRPAVGSIRITGVEMTADGDSVRITGNAGNVGDAEVTGVVLAVGETETVTPAYPQRDYFAGTIDGSEFAPFELTARVDDENATTVPIEVQYRVGGEPYNRTVEVPFDRDLDRDQSNGGGDLLSPLAVGLVAVALLVVAIGGVVARRRL